MDPKEIARYQQWLEPSATRSKEAPMQRMHFVKRSMTRKAIMHPNRRVTMQCMQGEDDKFYYIPLDSYNPAHLSIISELSPLLVNPTPPQFEPGAMYTYIIASIIRKDLDTNMDIEVVPAKLYATKALNMFEFGTKHQHIFYRMASTPELDEVAARNAVMDPTKLQYALYASGEIRCINKMALEFNFFSGTYKMQRKIPKRRAKYEIALITRLMQTIAPYTITFDFKPFIVQDIMRIKQDQIQHLKRKGIPAFGFDTQAQCRTMRTSVLRHKNVEGTDMTHERMNEAYASIVAPLAPLAPLAPPPASSAGPSTRPSMPLHALSRTELHSLATSLNLTLPEHILTLPERERRVPLIEAISAHYKSFNPAGGKKIRTLKKRKSNRCNLL
jgi:hypothetical protein